MCKGQEARRWRKQEEYQGGEIGVGGQDIWPIACRELWRVLGRGRSGSGLDATSAHPAARENSLTVREEKRQGHAKLWGPAAASQSRKTGEGGAENTVRHPSFGPALPGPWDTGAPGGSG